MNDMPVSERGFKRPDPVPGVYGGSARVYESSSAFDARVWLAVEEPTDLNAYMQGRDVPMKEATIHLELADAEVLRDQLTYLIENHYHKD